MSVFARQTDSSVAEASKESLVSTPGADHMAGTLKRGNQSPWSRSGRPEDEAVAQASQHKVCSWLFDSQAGGREESRMCGHQYLL